LPDAVRATGIQPFFRAMARSTSGNVEICGAQVVMLGSNNYLGLSEHPDVKAAAIEAVERYGSGCTGSRAMNGTLPLHEELEAELADFLGREAALLMSAGFLANLGAIGALVTRGDRVLVDDMAHASILEALRLTRAEAQAFRHNDVERLASALGASRGRALVIVESLYSMTGDVAPLREIAGLCERHGAGLYVDEAHAIGVFGNQGRGLVDELGVQESVDLVMGTLSKSLASYGGFVAGPRRVVDHIRSTARTFLFTASPPPAAVAAARAALRVVRSDGPRRERLKANTEYFASGLRVSGIDNLKSMTPIQPLVCGSSETTLHRWQALMDRGVYTNPAIAPAVPPRLGLLRSSVTSEHSRRQLDAALRAIRSLDWSSA
jgi:8-amino-7-oxononanoate synthase